jgi:hypothetical protein
MCKQQGLKVGMRFEGDCLSGDRIIVCDQRNKMICTAGRVRYIRPIAAGFLMRLWAATGMSRRIKADVVQRPSTIMESQRRMPRSKRRNKQQKNSNYSFHIVVGHQFHRAKIEKIVEICKNRPVLSSMEDLLNSMNDSMDGSLNCKKTKARRKLSAPLPITILNA